MGGRAYGPDFQKFLFRYSDIAWAIFLSSSRFCKILDFKLCLLKITHFVDFVDPRLHDEDMIF